MYKLLVIATILLMGITMFSGCLSEWQGVLKIYITDAPGNLNITKALIIIKNVKVHFSDGGSAEDNYSAGWITITNEKLTFDLIKLQDSKELIGSKLLDQGQYNQIRLYVESALLTINGSEYKLKIPSNIVKLNKKFEITGRDTTTLILDFDIQKSIKSSGKNKYILQPTIKVIKE